MHFYTEFTRGLAPETIKVEFLVLVCFKVQIILNEWHKEETQRKPPLLDRDTRHQGHINKSSLFFL